MCPKAYVGSQTLTYAEPQEKLVRLLAGTSGDFTALGGLSAIITTQFSSSETSMLAKYQS